MVKNNDGFPCDMLLINSSEDNGLCYVETKNLDGETSLKYKGANGKIAEMFQNEQDLSTMYGQIETKKPDEYIFEFNGNIVLRNGTLISVDKNNFLLRGCSLKQTEHVYGVAVYVGHNTKIMINSPGAKHKTSKIENIMNFQIIIIFCLDLVLSLIGAIMNLTLVTTYEVNSYIILG
jgi:magnesium-transporting ATPase (P-type)